MLRSNFHVVIATRHLNRFFNRSALLKSGQIRHSVHRSRIASQRRCCNERTSRGLSLKAFIDESWIDLLDEMQDPKTRELIQRLDLSFPLGINPEVDKVTALSFFQKMKREHPDKLILVRHGEVYEAIGIDAVMIVHFTSQPCSGKGVPMIKCSPMNRDYLLYKLTRELGFKVIICEESSQSYRQGKRRVSKHRYIAGIVGGAYKASYFNTKDPDATVDLDQAQEALPLAAVHWSQTGYSLLQYFAERNALKITSRMSEEALWAKLNSTGITPPLYLHRSSIPGSELDSTMKQWESQAERIAKRVFGSIKYYPASDPVEGFLTLLQNENPMIDVKDMVLLSEDVRDRTSPPPLSTVSEIGIQPREGSGVLPLLDYLIPERTPKILGSWIRECVLDPPPTEVAQHIQQVVRELMTLQISLPRSNARLTPTKLTKIFDLERIPLDEFIELRTLLEQLVGFLSEKEVATLAQSLLYVVHHETNVPVALEDFLENCQAAIDEISKVVLHPDSWKSFEYPSDTVEGIKPLFECMRDPFFCSINPKAVQRELENLESAERGLNQAAREIMEEIQSLGIFKKFFISSEEFKIRVVSEKTSKSLPFVFEVPDKSNTEQITTKDFDRAQAMFSAAYNAWHEKVQKRLKVLRMRLQKQLVYLITASHASIILNALTAHVIAAQGHQWCLPDITPLVQKQSGNLEINGFWPYWMERESSQLNSISLKGMVVLTGPNMAGKSTILRSVATVCSLAVCGLCIPAESAKIPFLDCVNLKTLVTDSPLEYLSAFGVEMAEMQHVLTDATHSSLLLIDELGKGTEVNGGTALAAAMLKDFCNRGCIGIFATHLHAIKEFEQEFPGVEYMQMEVHEEEDKRTSTWKMIPGFSEESFGLNVALEQGIPLSLINRAKELMRSLDGDDE